VDFSFSQFIEWSNFLDDLILYGFQIIFLIMYKIFKFLTSLVLVGHFLDEIAVILVVARRWLVHGTYLMYFLASVHDIFGYISKKFI
jgi:hypothetical protein